MNKSLLKYSHNYDPNAEMIWEKRSPEPSPTKRPLVNAMVSASIILKLVQNVRAGQAAKVTEASTAETIGAANTGATAATTAAADGEASKPSPAKRALQAFAGLTRFRKIAEAQETKPVVATSEYTAQT